MQLENKIISCTLLIIKKGAIRKTIFFRSFCSQWKNLPLTAYKVSKEKLELWKRIVRSKMPKTPRRHFKKNWPKKKNHNVSSQIDPALVIVKNHSL